MTAPERIWLDWPDANKGDVVYDEPPERDTQPGQTGYVRGDLHAAALAREAALREALVFYADLSSEGPWHLPSEDYGKRARAALGAQP